MRRVRVLDDKGKEYHYPIDSARSAEISIGRSESNDIVLGSKAVSRRHALLRVDGAKVTIVNQSANALWVGEDRVERERALGEGEYARIDVYRICVESSESPAASPAPRARPAARGGPKGSSGARRPLARRPASPARRPAQSAGSKKGDLGPFLKQMFDGQAASEVRVNVSGQPVQALDRGAQMRMNAFKYEIHEELRDRLDLHSFEISDYRNPKVVKQVATRLREVLALREAQIPRPYKSEDAFKQIMDEVCGLGPIEDLVRAKTVTEIMVVDRDHIYAEIEGKLVLTDRYFADERAMMTVIERIVIPRGRRVDESSPLVDTRLADGSRVNAVIAPLALKDPCLTIRKFPEERLGIEDLVRFGSVTPEMAKLIGRAVRARKNVIISGGTGSGKTTLLNVMSSFIGPTERVVTIEDAAELQLQQNHVVSLETKPANLEGKGEISIRDLVRNALRMRPDRIVVGECRGGEALDMLQAMNTGHDGSMTTVHSNSPVEAVARLETLVLMSGMDLPARAIREQIANSVDLIVQQTRFSDGSRRVSHIAEIVGIDEDGFIRIEDIYRYKSTGMDASYKVEGYHMATGYLPSFLHEFVILGLAEEGDFF